MIQYFLIILNPVRDWIIKPMKISHSVKINSAPEQVFFWLEDPERAKHWMTNVVHYEIIQETPNRVGSTFIEIIEENGKQLEMRGEITDFVSDQKIAFDLESKVHIVKVEFILERVKKGVLLTQNAHIQFIGFMKIMIFLFGFIFKIKITKQIKNEFVKLKKLCEGNDKNA